jgi:hypothetical protein
MRLQELVERVWDRWRRPEVVHPGIIKPISQDALNIEVQLQLEPNGTGTVIEKSTGRPIQFVGLLSAAKWEFVVDPATGRNCLKVSLENIPVINPYTRA